MRRLLLVSCCALLAPLAVAAATPAAVLQTGACGLDCATLHVGTLFATCLTAAFPDGKSSKLVLPGSPAYDYARRVANLRFNRKPAAVVYAHKTEDVQAAVRCAFAHGFRVSAAGGRHSYEGWAVPDQGFLVVDVSNMTAVEVVEKRPDMIIAAVGPGNTNALLASQVHKANKDAVIIVGQCPSVGVSGYMLGGGQGDLSRLLGLGCDQLVALELVTAEGKLVKADANHNSDLLWASCGGGGGLGIVVKWVIKSRLIPGPFTFFSVGLNAAAAREVTFIDKLQQLWMGTGLSSRFAGGSGGPSGMQGVFMGAAVDAVKELQQAGLLRKDWLVDTPSTANVAALVPRGVSAWQHDTYYDLVMRQECGWVAGNTSSLGYVDNAALYGFGRARSCDDPAVMKRFKEMAATPGSPINSGISDIWAVILISSCRMVPPLSADTWKALQTVRDNSTCQKLTDRTRFAALMAKDERLAHYCLALLANVGSGWLNHMLGGQVAKVSPTATAYWPRDRLSPLCFEGGLPASMLTADGRLVSGAVSMAMPGGDQVKVTAAGMVEAMAQVQADYLSVVYAKLGPAARSAYYNYMPSPMADWQRAYFGDNAARLSQIKAKWDPLGVFNKPFTITAAA